MRRAPILASLPLLAALSCLLAPAGGAATLDERFDQTFPLPAGGRLQIANTNGTISIEAWDRDEARIEAGKEVKAATEELARSTMSQLRIVATPGPGGLRVETRFPFRMETTTISIRGGPRTAQRSRSSRTAAVIPLCGFRRFPGGHRARFKPASESI